jgi:sulfur carrier protein
MLITCHLVDCFAVAALAGWFLLCHMRRLMANAMLTITLNGEPARIETGSTLGDLLRQHQLERREVALCVNDQIIPRSKLDETSLAQGDMVELVQFIGGG